MAINKTEYQKLRNIALGTALAVASIIGALWVNFTNYDHNNCERRNDTREAIKNGIERAVVTASMLNPQVTHEQAVAAAKQVRADLDSDPNLRSNVPC